MKNVAFVLAGLLSASSVYAESAVTGNYGIHLFFDEKEFVDTMKIYTRPDGTLAGDMHVPKDFDGQLSNIKLKDLKIEFDLFVPKNSARPVDLVFHYEGQYFDAKYEQAVGFVTADTSKDFIASFTAFKRK